MEFKRFDSEKGFGTFHKTTFSNGHPENDTVIRFQHGPVKEAGINGIQTEDLIQLCIDRIADFQKGDFACAENAIAINQLEGALMFLEYRTAKRKQRGVEGTSNI